MATIKCRSREQFMRSMGITSEDLVHPDSDVTPLARHDATDDVSECNRAYCTHTSCAHAVDQVALDAPVDNLLEVQQEERTKNMADCTPPRHDNRALQRYKSDEDEDDLEITKNETNILTDALLPDRFSLSPSSASRGYARHDRTAHHASNKRIEYPSASTDTSRWSRSNADEMPFYKNRQQHRYQERYAPCDAMDRHRYPDQLDSTYYDAEDEDDDSCVVTHRLRHESSFAHDSPFARGGLCNRARDDERVSATHRSAQRQRYASSLHTSSCESSPHSSCLSSSSQWLTTWSSQASHGLHKHQGNSSSNITDRYGRNVVCRSKGSGMLTNMLHELGHAADHPPQRSRSREFFADRTAVVLSREESDFYDCEETQSADWSKACGHISEFATRRAIRHGMRQAERYKQQGNALFESGRFAEAIKLFSYAIDVITKSQPFVLFLVSSSTTTNPYEHVCDICNRSDCDADVSHSYNHSCDDEHGNVRSIEEAHDDDYNVHAYAHSHARAYVSREQVVDLLAALFSNRSASYLQAARQFSSVSAAYRRARADALEAICQRSHWYKGYARLGDVLFKMNALAQATRAYERAVQLQPANGSVKRALNACRRLLLLQPEDDSVPVSASLYRRTRASSERNKRCGSHAVRNRNTSMTSTMRAAYDTENVNTKTRVDNSISRGSTSRIGINPNNHSNTNERGLDSNVDIVSQTNTTLTTTKSKSTLPGTSVEYPMATAPSLKRSHDVTCANRTSAPFISSSANTATTLTVDKRCAATGTAAAVHGTSFSTPVTPCNSSVGKVNSLFSIRGNREPVKPSVFHAFAEHTISATNRVPERTKDSTNVAAHAVCINEALDEQTSIAGSTIINSRQQISGEAKISLSSPSNIATTDSGSVGNNALIVERPRSTAHVMWQELKNEVEATSHEPTGDDYRRQQLEKFRSQRNASVTCASTTSVIQCTTATATPIKGSLTVEDRQSEADTSNSLLESVRSSSSQDSCRYIGLRAELTPAPSVVPVAAVRRTRKISAKEAAHSCISDTSQFRDVYGRSSSDAGVRVGRDAKAATSVFACSRESTPGARSSSYSSVTTTSARPASRIDVPTQFSSAAATAYQQRLLEEFRRKKKLQQASPHT